MASIGTNPVRSVVRYQVDGGESKLAFFAKATIHTVYGRAAHLTGFVAISSDGDCLDLDTDLQMHVEFPVETLRSGPGNELKDAEMWKMIDSKRFPRIAADLAALSPGSRAGTFRARGRITMAGLTREYENELTIQRDSSHICIDGCLRLDVRDFGLKQVKLLMFSVEPEVKIRLHLVAERAV